MMGTGEERSPEATRRLARLAGAVYVSLGIASALGFYHMPVVQSDLTAIAHALTRFTVSAYSAEGGRVWRVRRQFGTSQVFPQGPPAPSARVLLPPPPLSPSRATMAQERLT
jgi:hypothetical protein